MSQRISKSSLTLKSHGVTLTQKPHLRMFYEYVLRHKVESRKTTGIKIINMSLQFLHRLYVWDVKQESGICKDPGFAPASVHLVFFVLSASETGLLLVVKLGRNVVMMHAVIKIMHQINARRP